MILSPNTQRGHGANSSDKTTTDPRWLQACQNISRHTRTHDIKGHQRVIETLNSISANHSNGALLFAGPRGVGKASLALRFALHLTQPQTLRSQPFTGAVIPENDPRFSSLQALTRLSHSDIIYHCLGMPNISDRKLTDSNVISVSSTRMLIKNASLLPQEKSGRRCIIIDGIENMHAVALDTMLKALEEPRHGIFFLLVCHNPEKLKATILSRCITLRLMPLINHNEIIEVMQALSSLSGEANSAHQNNSNTLIADMCGGCPGMALAYNAINLPLGIMAVLSLLCGHTQRWMNLKHELAPSTSPAGTETLPWAIFQYAISQLGKIIIDHYFDIPHGVNGHYRDITALAPRDWQHIREQWPAGRLFGALDTLQRYIAMISPPTSLMPELCLKVAAQECLRITPRTMLSL